MFPPTDADLQLISQDIKNEIKKCQANPRWSGGVIPSNFKPYYANVDPDGNFRKVYYFDGNRKEFFIVS